MAAWLNKWLIYSSIPLLFYTVDSPFAKQESERDDRHLPAHPFHVSVVEINHNAGEKTFEISCKIFTDDFEKVLAKNYKMKVDLINPGATKSQMDTLIKKYIVTHLAVTADGKPVNFTYLGFEHENDAVYGYVQADGIAGLKTLTVTNTLMHDLFTDQINLMHVTVGGKRKSTKLEYPSAKTEFSF